MTFSVRFLFALLLLAGATSLSAQVLYPAADDCGNALDFGDDSQMIRMLDGRLAFFDRQGDSRSVWVSDPVAGNTRRVRATMNAADLIFHASDNEALYFEEKRGDDLVITALRTGSDTLEVLYTSPEGADIDILVHWNGSLYFDEQDGFQDEVLIRYDLATQTSTTLFTSDFGGIRGIGSIDDYLIFVANTEAGKMLLRSDGTAAGTEVLTMLYEAGSEFSPSVRMHSNGEKLFFFYHPNNNPYNLWVTDGTTEGTTLLESYTNVTNLPPRRGAFLGDRFIYIARDQGTPSGTTLDLHVSDGTPEGTFNLNDNSSYLHPRLLTPFKDKIYFSSIQPGNWGIYSTDGTIAGTQSEIPAYGDIRNLFHFNSFRDSLVFGGTNFDTNTGQELYISDGTPAGSRLLADLVPGEADSNPSDFISDDNALFFFTSPEFGKQLWIYLPDADTAPGQPLTLVDSTIVNVEDNMIGSATFTVSGGSPPYVFSLDNGQENTDGEFSELGIGDYELTVTDQNGCSFTLTFTVDVVIATEQANALLERMQVFPNPSQGDRVTLKLTTKAILLQPICEIWTLQGQLLQSHTLDANRTWTVPLDLSGLAAGSYLILLKDQQQTIGRTVIVKS